MSHNFNISDVIEELRGLLKLENVIVFAGSGISKEAGYPDWNELSVELSKIINSVKWVDQNEFLRLSLFEQLEIIRFISEKAYYAKLGEIFSNKGKNSYSSYHTSILEWPIRGIVTTNFDTCFEAAHQSLIGENAYTFSYLESDKLEGAIDFKRYIFHLHGDTRNLQKMILTKKDYKKLYEEEEFNYVREWFKGLFSHYRFIFIGFSLKDLYVMHFPEWFSKIFREPRLTHYALMPATEENLSLELKIIDQFKIKPLFFPTLGGNYTALKQIVAGCTVKQMVSSFAFYSTRRDPGQLLDRISERRGKSELPPPPRMFFGRKESLSKIEQFLNNDDDRVFVIRGMAGIGKSAIIKKAMSRFSSNYVCFFYHPLIDGYSFIDFIKEICKQFLDDRFQALKWDDSLRNLLSLFDGFLIRIVIDDFDKCLKNGTVSSNEIKQFLSILKSTKSKTKVIIISRFNVDLKWFDINSQSLRIGELKETEILEWLNKMGVKNSSELLNRFYPEIGGNPKAWEIVLANIENVPASEIKIIRGRTQRVFDFLLDQTFSNLSQLELRILQLFSASRRDIKAIFVRKLNHSIACSNAIRSLQNFLLLSVNHSNGSYEIHGIIKNHTDSKLSIEKRQRVHRFWARCYYGLILKEQKHDVNTFLYIREALYHCQQGGHEELSLKALIRFLTKYPHNCDAAAIIDFFRENESLLLRLPENLKIKAISIKADYHKNLGNSAEAISLYKSILEQYLTLEPLKKCEVYLKLAELNTLQRKKKSLDEANNYLDSAQRILESHQDEHLRTDKYLQARLNLVRGNLFKQKDEFENAKTHYLKNIQDSTIRLNAQAQAPVAETYRSIANLNSYLMLWDQSTDDYKIAIEIFKAQNELMGLSTCYHSIASNYRKLPNYELSQYYYKKSIDLKESLGDVHGLARCYSGLSKLYRDQGMYDDALKSIGTARKLHADLHDEEGMAIDYLIQGRIYERMESFQLAKEHYDTSLIHFEALGIKHRIAEVHNTIAIHHKRNNNFVSAREEFEIASSFYKIISDDIREGICHFEIGVICYKQLSYGEALQALERCTNQLHKHKQYLFTYNHKMQIIRLISGFILSACIFQRQKDVPAKDAYLSNAESLIIESSNPEIRIDILRFLQSFLDINDFNTVALSLTHN